MTESWGSSVNKELKNIVKAGKFPTQHILNHDGLPRDRTKTVLLGASLISSSTPWLAKGDHRVKPGEVSWPRWARACATSWWVGVSSLVWMGGEEDPRPVGDEVAGVATPPQGQYGLSHLFHWEHFLKEIIVLKNRDEARTCVAMSR